MIYKSLIAVVAAGLTVAAGSQAHAQNPSPTTVEASQEDAKFEAILQQALANDGKGPKLKEEYLASVLNIYYRMLNLQEEFYQANLETLEKQKADPNYEMPIHRIPSYLQLRASWPLSEELEHKIMYIYDRLSKISRDSASPQQQVAVGMLGEMHDWIAKLDDQDRLLMAALLKDLSDIKSKYDVTANAKKGDRQVASATNFDFQKYNFGGKSDLSEYFTKYDTQLKARAKAAMATKNAEYDEAIASTTVVADDRVPASVPTVFKPSTGPDGTFSGLSLPRGEFVQTFDDGPNPVMTDKLIDIAAAYHDNANPKGVPITFFWLAKNAALYPKQIARAKSLNILMNNHSWTHPIFHKLTPAQLHHEIADAEVFLTKAFGVQPVIGTSKMPFFRCPYGDCIYANHNHGVPVARELIAAQKEIHILWNIDSNDWAAINRMNPQRTAQLTIAQMKTQHRGVILNHDIQPHTPDAFNIVLAWVKSQNETANAGIHYINVKDAVDQSNAAAMKK